MRDVKRRIKIIAILAVITGLAVIGVLNLRDRLSPRSLPTDGVYWVQTADGIKAKSISPTSPLVLRLREGDYLRFIFYNGKYEKITHTETVSRYIDSVGIGGRARYVIEHPDVTLQNIYRIEKPLYDFDFQIVEAPEHLGRGLYLAVIGLVYLAIGLFVLYKQPRAPLTYHFLAWFVASFVMYFYGATKEFTTLDKLVDFLDGSAFALLAPLFLHFCARFSSRIQLSRKGNLIAGLLYLPGVALVVLEVLYHYAPAVFPSGSLLTVRDRLDNAELIQYAIYFAVGSAILVISFIKATTSLHRQQLKWIVWGLSLSVLPFVVLYFVPYVTGSEISPIMQTLAYGPLILIPLSFGYSIIRYRLMDVDVIMRRSFVHLVAMAALGAIYMALLLGVGDLVKFVWPTADLNSWGGTRLLVVFGMLIVAMMFSPIKNWLQIGVDRWFYGERYTLRQGVQEFGRMLAQTTALPELLDSVAERLADLLSVRKVALFVVDSDSDGGFRMAHSLGLDREIALPGNVLEIIHTRSLGRGFVSQHDLIAGESAARADKEDFTYENWDGNGRSSTDESRSNGFKGQRGTAQLYYYVPCIVRDKTVAIIGLGRTTTGALLTSEDTDLLRALSGYVAVAIDNSLLYRSEMQKADELARLKDFSENIIESVSVGIIVVDLAGRITTWNGSAERLFGIRRVDALGLAAADVLHSELIDAIQRVTGRLDWLVDFPRHIYKCAIPAFDGSRVTVNLSVAPFESAPGVISGAIMVLENVTERVLLEQQLMEREKLSSIGLLAAGVAHEVNTPLAGISSYSQMLLQQIPESDPKRQLLQKIHAQTLRASGIVSNLLNFSRTGNTRFTEFDMNQVLEDTLLLLEPQLRNSSVEVVRNYSSDAVAGWGNASKLQQVFMNLILNARDAMQGGGKLTIHTRQVETSLVVDFKDTGCGIEPEDIVRIYDPFFTTKEVGQGTGLGLALSYGIIQEHGGRIFVESRPGEGAHFTIKLPTAQSRQMQVASD